jgi:hypothetical protein
MNHELRFDIVEAWYVWLCSHHCGIVSGRGHPDWWMSYNRLSFIPTQFHFKPASDLQYETLSEIGKEIHNNLCRRGGFCDCKQLEETDGEADNSQREENPPQEEGQEGGA